MALLLTLARGAVAGIGKRPSWQAELPEVRLSRPAVRIDAARVAAYEEVCGFPDGGGTLPLTYPHILGFPLAARIMAARAFPLPLLGLVHTGITITSRAPLRVTDRPELLVHAEELREHRRGTEVVMVTRASLGGEVVWEDRSTYLARHGVAGATAGTRHPAGAGKAVRHPAEEAQEAEEAEGSGEAGRRRGAAAEPPAEAAGTGRPPGAPGAEHLPLAEGARHLTAAEELPERAVWRLPADLGRRHARVSGDYNPIHLYGWTARPLGFRRPIAHGMWTLARCVALRPGVRCVRAEFRRPVLLPSTVQYAAEGPRFALRGAAGVHLAGEAGLTESSAGPA